MPDPINLQLVLPYYLLAFAGGYLSGSIPFGLIVTRLAGAGDIRAIGSGNIGATNVLRTGKKGLAAATLVLDAFKGALPVLIASLYHPDLMVFAGLGAFLGHLWPIWLKFKGGKGVAVALGILLGLSWLPALLCLATWIAVVAVSRVSSLAALYTAALAPLYFWAFSTAQFTEFVCLLAVLVWITHRANIARLWAGTEPRLGQKTT